MRFKRRNRLLLHCGLNLLLTHMRMHGVSRARVHRVDPAEDLAAHQRNGFLGR